MMAQHTDCMSKPHLMIHMRFGVEVTAESLGRRREPVSRWKNHIAHTA